MVIDLTIPEAETSGWPYRTNLRYRRPFICDYCKEKGWANNMRKRWCSQGCAIKAREVRLVGWEEGKMGDPES